MKTMRLIPALFALLACSENLASAFDKGGAHNGPDLSGPGERLGDGRELAVNDLALVIEGCLVDQVRPIVQSIWGIKNLPRFKTTVRAARGLYCMPESNRPTASNPNALVLLDYAFSSKNYYSNEWVDANRSLDDGSHISKMSLHASVHEGATSSTFRFYVVIPEKISSGYGAQMRFYAQDFPVLLFESKTVPVQYSSIGLPTSEMEFATNIRLYASKSVKLPVMNDLYNLQTPTQFSISSKRYEACLRSKIAAASLAK